MNLPNNSDKNGLIFVKKIDVNLKVMNGGCVTLLLTMKHGSIIGTSNLNKSLERGLVKGEAPPTLIRRQQFEKNSMFIVFFMTT